MKKKIKNVKAEAVILYADLRSKGLSHSLAFAACIEMVEAALASGGASDDAEKSKEESPK